MSSMNEAVWNAGLAACDGWRLGASAPKDGSRIWAWLYDGGIHLMQWVSAQESADADGYPERPEEYIDCWVKAADQSDGDWTVKFWLPESAIPVPQGVEFITSINKWRDKTTAPADNRTS